MTIKASRRRTPKGQAKARPKLLRISEEVRRWSGLLEQELAGWPGVTSRPMFGFAGFYRDGAIFAGLPRTRALETPSSIILKFDPMPPELARRAGKDPRIGGVKESGARWYSFELRSENDLRDALWWLNRAYEEAK